MTIGHRDHQAHHHGPEEVAGLAVPVAHRLEVGVGGQEQIGAQGAQVPGQVGGVEGDVVGSHLGDGEDDADDECVELVGDHAR